VGTVIGLAVGVAVLIGIVVGDCVGLGVGLGVGVGVGLFCVGPPSWAITLNVAPSGVTTTFPLVSVR
jgi:hypothetical protein